MAKHHREGTWAAGTWAAPAVSAALGARDSGLVGLPFLVVATTTAELAAALGVSEGDLEVLLGQLGERAARLPTKLASFLRSVLDLHGERTAPTGLYWPGAQREPGRANGLGGPDPMAPE